MGLPLVLRTISQNAQFWRFREFAANITLPQHPVQRFLRAQDASLTLGPRNLEVWTKYTGEDPESNYSSGDTRNTLLTTAPPTAATNDAAIDLYFRQKAFWTFSRGQRLGDLRRLIRQYGRTQDKVFPTGNG
jgi:hypothetical protein